MKIAVVGTGNVGLVSVTLSEIGHHVIEKKLGARRLVFTTSYEEGFNDVQVIYIDVDVGTPENDDGSAKYVEQMVTTIALTAKQDTSVVTKSTVPVGTNDRLQRIIDHNKLYHINIEIVSNPEFLREGSPISDAYYGDINVIGANNNCPFGIPIYKTDIRSAEMIKKEFCLIVRKDIKPNFPAPLEVGEGK